MRPTAVAMATGRVGGVPVLWAMENAVAGRTMMVARRRAFAATWFRRYRSQIDCCSLVMGVGGCCSFSMLRCFLV